MIVAIVGDQGSAKTTLMSLILLMSKKANHKIITNYSFRFNDYKLSDENLENDSEFLKALAKENCIVDLAIDEAHLFFDSRSSQKNHKKSKILTQCVEILIYKLLPL